MAQICAGSRVKLNCNFLFSFCVKKVKYSYMSLVLLWLKYNIICKSYNICIICIYVYA